jgi:anti-sigma factor RsiW
MSRDEAERLIGAALCDHARVPAPARLRNRLDRRYGRRERRWLLPTLTGLGGAIAAAAIAVVVLRPAAVAPEAAAFEAVGDHQRVLAERELGVVTNNLHNVKPWFAGKIEFVPPIAFLGDEDYPLRGGDVAVFLGHKAATFVYGRRLHVISLFVFEGDAPADEQTIRGFHVMTWSSGGFGFALVSDVSWDDLRTLRARIAS